MRAILQRVAQAQVVVDNLVVGKIQRGILVLVGFEPTDKQEDYQWVARKLLNMRIFNDDAGVMNISLLDSLGELLVVSQFTLHASTKKGNRPSYSLSSPPDMAKSQYQDFLNLLRSEFSGNLQTGIFGADMKVELLNDGPVTISLDSKRKE